MSEPVSNAEIEDVLSSIRRLVSNDVEAFQEKAVAELAKAEPAAKLILTADFRVSVPQDEQTDSTESEANANNGADFTTTGETPTDDVVEFLHMEQSSGADADFEDAFVAEFEAGPTGDANNTAANTEDQHDAADVVTDAAPVSALEGTIADLEAAIGQQDGEWEPDGSGFEEDADAEEVMSEPVQDWIDGTAKDLDAAAAVAEADDEDPDLFGAQESVIDEETLRDMVSDIVRQELQGALGERITRNVRKLVRREINRVLASQDFD